MTFRQWYIIWFVHVSLNDTNEDLFIIVNCAGNHWINPISHTKYSDNTISFAFLSTLTNALLVIMVYWLCQISEGRRDRTFSIRLHRDLKAFSLWLVRQASTASSRRTLHDRIRAIFSTASAENRLPRRITYDATYSDTIVSIKKYTRVLYAKANFGPHVDCKIT